MKRNSMSATYTIGAIALLGILAFAIIPQASAMTPQFQVLPSPVGLSKDVTLTYEGQAAQDTHTVLLTRVHEPGATAAQGNSDAAGIYDDCDPLNIIDKASVPADPVQWELRNFDGPDVGEPFQIFGLDEGDMVMFSFGKGLASVPVTVIDGGDANPVTVSAANVVWVNIHPTSVAVDNLDIDGQWRWESCGTESDLGAGPLGDWDSEQSIIVVIPVSGEILPISTTALLLAGLSTSTMWIVPAIGAFAGISVTLYKLRRNI